MVYVVIDTSNLDPYISNNIVFALEIKFYVQEKAILCLSEIDVEGCYKQGIQ